MKKKITFWIDDFLLDDLDQIKDHSYEDIFHESGRLHFKSRSDLMEYLLICGIMDKFTYDRDIDGKMINILYKYEISYD